MTQPWTRVAGALCLSFWTFAPEVLEARVRPQLEALSITDPIVVDGRLDEVAWAHTQVGSSFVQREPFDGEPASEPTEIRVAYTPATLYIAIRAMDSEPESLIAREMGRDSGIQRDDSIVVLLDTFRDRRNAYSFATNPNGARTDLLITDEGRDINREWDGVWAVGTQRTAEGWQAELAIPFSTLRYDPSLDTWGFQVLRRIRRNSEETFWAPIPRQASLTRISMAGDLTGLGGLKPARQIDIKPFIVLSSEEAQEAPGGEDGDVGLDVKWGVARNLALDLTLNTDFAEVEVDEQRVNLTRFPLFFPEKREFFLENAGIFEFGPRSRGRGGPLFKAFFSRRIGLDEGEEVPIDIGGRLTGRIGSWNIGALGVLTDSIEIAPEASYGVARIKRNLGERSSVGAIFTQRDEEGPGSNQVYGLDADFNPSDKINVNAFLSDSSTPELGGDSQALGLGTSFNGRELDFGLEYLEIGGEFNPELGFLLRSDIRRYRPSVEYEPRIEWRNIRNLRLGANAESIRRLSDGALESQSFEITYFGARTFKDDGINLDYEVVTEQLFEPFEIQDDIVLPPGRYEADPRWGLFVFSGDHRKFSTRFGGSTGGFFDGRRTGFFANVRVRANRFFRAETTWNHNDVNLPAGDFTTNVYRQRLDLTLSREHIVNALVQYSDSAELFGVNLRYNWIYRPGADLFVVYNETWDAPSLSALASADRKLIVKFTYLIQR